MWTLNIAKLNDAESGNDSNSGKSNGRNQHTGNDTCNMQHIKTKVKIDNEKIGFVTQSKWSLHLSRSQSRTRCGFLGAPHGCQNS